MENKLSINEAMMTMPRQLFLYAYLIVPFLLAVALADMFYFNSYLLPHMGVEALFLLLYVFIFSLPHIIASFFSFFSFFDTEYVRYYRKHLFLYLPLLLIGTAFLLYENYVLGLVFFLVNDIWHGVRQKVGIALILGAKPGWLHRLWTLAPFVTASIAYVYVIRPNAYPDILLPYVSPALFVGAIAMFVLMIAKIWTSPVTVRWYIFAVSMLFLVSYFFILAGYIFFSILLFRFVHDVSAFAFYVTHDYNRKKNANKNFLYQLLTIVPLPFIILTPVLGLLFAYLVRTVTDGIAIGYSIIILICMSHFYLESVMWKRDTPHRKYVKVV